jgi:hypothetical protein
VHSISNVRQIEIHTAKLLVPDPSPSQAEIAIAKFKKYKLLGSDQIPVELIQVGGETLWSEIHELNTVRNKEELPYHITIYIKGDKTDCSNYQGI